LTEKSHIQCFICRVCGERFWALDEIEQSMYQNHLLSIIYCIQ
jgi:hypothetical protein